MNECAVDFSKISLRKFSHVLSNVDFNAPMRCTVAQTSSAITSSNDMPHELRKSITILNLIKSSGRYSESELLPLQEKINKLKEQF